MILTSLLSSLNKHFNVFFVLSHRPFQELENQTTFVKKIRLPLRPDFRGRIISFLPGLWQEHIYPSPSIGMDQCITDSKFYKEYYDI